MKISKLIAVLQAQQAKLGDVEVTMQATLLSDGFSATNTKTMPDVFESTVENVIAKSDGELGQRVRLYWQS